MLSKRFPCARVPFAALAALLLATPVAHAQSYPAPPPPPPSAQPPGATPATTGARAASVRDGLTVGGGIGLGSIADEQGPIECLECESSAAGSLGLHAGWMINPRLAVGADVWVAAQALDQEGNTTLVQVLTTAAAQYWFKPRWWVKAGVGAARLSENDRATGDSADLGKGTAVMAAVGFEAWRHGRYVLDVAVRAASASYDDLAQSYTQGALQIGVSWY